MNDRRIMFRDGALGMSVTVDEMNTALAPHGLHIAPLHAPATPQQTEAERLVGVAKGLPVESTDGWSAIRRAHVDEEHDILIGGVYYGRNQFRTILLGVMSAYISSQTHAGVFQRIAGDYEWTDGEVEKGCCDDILTAYAACCKAIAERRKGGA